jgi:two-component system cell cycle sensor histidine kinase/response regulator CckA
LFPIAFSGWLFSKDQDMKKPEMPKIQLEKELSKIRKKMKDLEAENLNLREKLEDATELYRVLIDTFPDAVTMTDLEGKIIRVSQKTNDLHGIKSDEELIGKNAFELIAPADHEKARQNLARTLENGLVKNIQYRLRRRNGTEFIGELHTALIRDTHGDPKSFVATTRDITHHKQAENALRESEERYRQLIESQNDGIYLLFNRKFEIINKKFGDMFQVTIEDLNRPEFDFIQLVAPKSRFLIEERVKKSAQGIELEPKYEFTALAKDGKEIDVEASVSYIKYKKGIAVLGIVRDISERKKLEKQLLQAQKLEGIGRLAGGIAHDFNNLLTSMIGYVGLVNMKLKADDPCRDYIRQTLKAADRATTLVQQLLAFSRKAISKPRVIDINQVIQSFSKMLQRVLGEDIDFEFIPAGKIDSVEADPVQIEQIIMNLAVNSRDAMPRGGKLSVETRNCVLDEDYVRKHPYVKKGSYVLLMVSDTGVGMDEETLSKIFDPFFTTKIDGEGTGLGLSMVYGITKQSGGHINVYSEINKGSTFKIYFPKVNEPAEKLDSSPSMAVFPRGNETIMVVEDDNTVREMIMDILSQSGYRVYSASSGKETLKIWEKYGDSVQLLITDVVMPGMSGLELAKKLWESHPGVKVLYMSGYTMSIASRNSKLDPGSFFIQKPFNATELTIKIRKILDS